MRRTKVNRTKNNMKRTKSYRKRRVTKHGMKGGWGLQLPVPSLFSQKKAAINEEPKMYGGWVDANQI